MWAYLTNRENNAIGANVTLEGVIDASKLESPSELTKQKAIVAKAYEAVLQKQNAIEGLKADDKSTLAAALAAAAKVPKFEAISTAADAVWLPYYKKILANAQEEKRKATVAAAAATGNAPIPKNLKIDLAKAFANLIKVTRLNILSHLALNHTDSSIKAENIEALRDKPLTELIEFQGTLDSRLKAAFALNYDSNDDKIPVFTDADLKDTAEAAAAATAKAATDLAALNAAEDKHAEDTAAAAAAAAKAKADAEEAAKAAAEAATAAAAAAAAKAEAEAAGAAAAAAAAAIKAAATAAEAAAAAAPAPAKAEAPAPVPASASASPAKRYLVTIRIPKRDLDVFLGKSEEARAEEAATTASGLEAEAAAAAVVSAPPSLLVN